ncbi:MAG: hypothetical protein P8185_03930 [Deltaproteobacteria bacterium]
MKPRLEVISIDDFEKIHRANEICKEILAAAPESLIDQALEEVLEAYIDSEL